LNITKLRITLMTRIKIKIPNNIVVIPVAEFAVINCSKLLIIYLTFQAFPANVRWDSVKIIIFIKKSHGKIKSEFAT
jgi:hypothetical protein